MSKLHDTTQTFSTTYFGDECEVDTTANNEEAEEKNGKEEEEKETPKFTMLFYKYNNFLDIKRSSRNDEKRDNKYSMFFNKDVTIRSKPEILKALQSKKSENFQDSRLFLSNRIKLKSCQSIAGLMPQISEPDMIFSKPSTSSLCYKPQNKTESVKKSLNKRNSKVDSDTLVQLNVYPATQNDLKTHNSLTNLSKNKSGGPLKSKIPSLTALDSNIEKNKLNRSSYWDHWDDLMLMQSDVDKRLNLQISRSSNDNNTRSTKLKKEDAASVSDSKLPYTNSECKKQIKKCDRKSRGDSSRKEKDSGNKKQVQWKTEVDVIYFSTHMAANGDRTREVIGRVMEPLREEWEQQRNGFYAKVAPSSMENHMNDRFISLLKI